MQNAALSKVLQVSFRGFSFLSGADADIMHKGIPLFPAYVNMRVCVLKCAWHITDYGNSKLSWVGNLAAVTSLLCLRLLLGLLACNLQKKEESSRYRDSSLRNTGEIFRDIFMNIVLNCNKALEQGAAVLNEKWAGKNFNMTRAEERFSTSCCPSWRYSLCPVHFTCGHVAPSQVTPSFFLQIFDLQYFFVSLSENIFQGPKFFVPFGLCSSAQPQVTADEGTRCWTLG